MWVYTVMAGWRCVMPHDSRTHFSRMILLLLLLTFIVVLVQGTVLYDSVVQVGW